MPEDFPPKSSGIRSKNAAMVPKKFLKGQKRLTFARANPWDAQPTEVQVYIGNRDKKPRKSTQGPVDGQDQPNTYEILDHRLEVLMHPSVLELHAVRVVHTPHGHERQLHLKVRVLCRRKEVVIDVFVDTGAQVSLLSNGLFRDTCLKSSDRPVRLKVANGRIMGGGACEAELRLESWQQD